MSVSADRVRIEASSRLSIWVASRAIERFALRR
jgi:hypothetical protein